MSARTIGSYALLALAALMLWGFLRSDASLASPRTLIALLITVGIPAGAGIMLLRAPGGRRSARVEELRRQTIEAEILRLAMQHGGRLTVVEVASALALPPESAKATLDFPVPAGPSMVMTMDDAEVTDAGASRQVSAARSTTRQKEPQRTRRTQSCEKK
jgi:hypothetical protein